MAKKGDNNAEQDYVRMCYWGVETSNDSYWLASRFVGGSTLFSIMRTYSDMDWIVVEGEAGVSVSQEYIGSGSETIGVRSCVTVDK